MTQLLGYWFVAVIFGSILWVLYCLIFKRKIDFDDLNDGKDLRSLEQRVRDEEK